MAVAADDTQAVLATGNKVFIQCLMSSQLFQLREELLVLFFEDLPAGALKGGFDACPVVCSSCW